MHWFLWGLLGGVMLLSGGCASGPHRPNPGASERLEVTAKQLRPLISLKSRQVVRSEEEEQVALLEEQAIQRAGEMSREELDALAALAAPEASETPEMPVRRRLVQEPPPEAPAPLKEVLRVQQPVERSEVAQESALPLVGEAFLQQQFFEDESLSLEEFQSLQAAAAPEVVPEGSSPFLVRLHFDYKQAVVKPEYQPGLRELALMLRQTGVRALLEGHCDDRGSNGYNLGLGSERAEEVKAYLMGLGVPEAQLETLSFGEERPLSQERTEAAHAMNRRVEVVLMRPRSERS